jgi:hypothetical protein
LKTRQLLIPNRSRFLLFNATAMNKLFPADAHALFSQHSENINGSAGGVFGLSLELCWHASLNETNKKYFSESQVESLVCNEAG